ncbi:MAG: DMT family transporter [Pseudomonadota bacterium]|nr:DMT family transporter [Pseudomonadota bacterium]
MHPYDVARFLGLATIWSFQYIFLRVAVPEFGIGAVADSRAIFGALVLIPAALAMGQRIGPLEHWKDHLAVSLVNNVLPFACFAYAASALPAAYLSILNGLVPLWTAVFAAWVLHEPLGPRRSAGFVLGMVGVALIVQLGPIALDTRTVLATLVAVLGAAAWGYAGVMIKQRTGKLPPIGLAAGSIAFSALIMSPLLATAPKPSWGLEATASLIGLGALCSGVSYLAFFTLVRDIGPSRTLAVGFLVPVLGILWGWLILDEAVTLPMLGGAALVLFAMALVLKR